MTNTETESMEYYDKPWTEKSVYPYGICFEIVGSEFTRSLHYMKYKIEFTELNIGFTMKVTDRNQWSYVPNKESFCGQKVAYENGTDPEFGIFNMQIQEHAMDSKDPKAKCSNYGTQEKNLSLTECFKQKTKFLGIL
jgi:hypothetical protein